MVKSKKELLKQIEDLKKEIEYLKLQKQIFELQKELDKLEPIIPFYPGRQYYYLLDWNKIIVDTTYTGGTTYVEK